MALDSIVAVMLRKRGPLTEREATTFSIKVIPCESGKVVNFDVVSKHFQLVRNA